MKLPLEDITVGALLRRTAGKYPDRPALEYRGHVRSYRELDSEVDEVARRLLALGIRKGEHVGMWCEAEPNAVLFMYACARIGAAACLINTSLNRAELSDILDRSDVTKLFIGDGYKELRYTDICRGLAGEVGCLEMVCYMGLSGRNAGFPVLSELPMASEEELKAAEDAVLPEDTCYILYTSGTTSVPKAVLGSHYSRANSAIQQAHDLGATKEDRFCAAMPIFHCFCLSVSVLAPCAVGGCLYLPESRRTGSLLDAIDKGKCTIMSSVPTLFHAILSRPDFQNWDVSSLRTGFVGGGMVSTELFEKIDRGLDFTLLSSLGQTEATAGITTAFLDDPLELRSHTLGHFMDHVEGKIVDIENGEDLPTGETGEICVRGYNVMQGYYRMPEETAAVLEPSGWLHTGDMGYLDENGNLHMTGRLKELIIRGGENISPAEIEHALADNEAVEDCKAISVPDIHYGEEACLCVVTREGHWFNEAELRAELTRKLAQYKVPRYIIELRELPRTSSGKVKLQELSAKAKKILGLEDR